MNTNVFYKTIHWYIASLYLLITFNTLLSETDNPISKTIKQTLAKNLIHNKLPKQYRLEREPSSPHQYLQTLIKAYTNKIKQTIIPQLKHEYTLNKDNNIKELLFLLNQSNQASTVNEVVVILTRATQVYDALDQQYLANSSLNNAIQEGFCAIALQISSVLSLLSQEQLILMLNEIHNTLTYWKQQKNHPIYHFLHKSPTEWFSQKSQKRIVLDNIEKLEKLEFNIRVILGQLVKHTYDFNLAHDRKETYHWIKDLLSMLAIIGKQNNKNEDQSEFKQISRMLEFKLTRIENLKNSIFAKLPAAIKPSHLSRHWLTYLTGAIAAYTMVNFYKNNQNWTNQALSNIASSSLDTMNVVIKPIKTRIEKIIGNQKNEEQLATAAKELRGLLPEMQQNKVTLDQGEQLIHTSLGRKQDNINELKNLLVENQKTWFRSNWSTQDIEKIISDVENNDLNSLQSLTYNTTISSPNLKIQLERLLKTFEYGDTVKGTVSTLSTIGAVMPIIVESTATILEGNSLNAELLTFIPAASLVGLTYKGYNWATTRDYSLLRLALIEVSELLAESDAPLNDHDYGKLIYLTQRLKTQAKKHISQKNIYQDFITDVTKLESNVFTAKQKKAIIKNMLLKYDFLSSNKKTA